MNLGKHTMWVNTPNAAVTTFGRTRWPVVPYDRRTSGWDRLEPVRVSPRTSGVSLWSGHADVAS